MQAAISNRRRSVDRGVQSWASMPRAGAAKHDFGKEMLIEKTKFDRIDPPMPEPVAADLARTIFGIVGSASRLTGERDLNYCIQTSDDVRYLLKVSNSGEDASVADLQTKALLHLARTDPEVPVPRIVSTLDGMPQGLWHEPGGHSGVVRLLTFVDGRPLEAELVTSNVLVKIGRSLAQLGAALADFRHPSDEHDLLWDLQHIDHAEEMLAAIPDPSRRSLAERSLAFFEDRVRPRLDQLRRQVIHNDLNPSNILIGRGGGVSGLLDLGDAIYAPLVNDVAIAAAYHVGISGRPLHKVGALLKGYVSVRRLTDEEIGMIMPLIVARLSKIVTISAWRAEAHPTNRPYILRNAETSWRALEALLALDIDGLSSSLRRLAEQFA